MSMMEQASFRAEFWYVLTWFWYSITIMMITMIRILKY